MDLNGRHHEAIALSLVGLNQEQIAKELGVGYRTVKRWFADAAFTAELIRMARQEFAYLIGEAKEVVLEVMRDKTAGARTRVAAAQDIMDRGGMKPTEKVETKGDLNVTGDVQVVLRMPDFRKQVTEPQTVTPKAEP